MFAGRLFYWLGARYDFPLLIQATVMIGVQVLILADRFVNGSLRYLDRIPPFGNVALYSPRSDLKTRNNFMEILP